MRDYRSQIGTNNNNNRAKLITAAIALIAGVGLAAAISSQISSDATQPEALSSAHSISLDLPKQGSLVADDILPTLSAPENDQTEPGLISETPAANLPPTLEPENKPSPALTATKVTPEAATPPKPASIAIKEKIEAPLTAKSAKTQHHTIKSGDSLGGILGNMGVDSSEIHALVHTNKNTRKLTRIRPGQILTAAINDDGQIQELSYAINDLTELKVTRSGNTFKTATIEREVERRITRAMGYIDNSLFLSAQAAGMSDNVTMKLAEIFGWDIDFALDVRSGDQFAVIYEELFLDGDKLRDGKILSAEFVNRGKSYQAVLYTNPKGRASYFSPEGRSMKKAFLRTPVDFARISSRFNLKRKHPVLNRIRAHKGVDYAASKGTPIRATGNGRITHRARKGGYGNTVIVQHGQKYKTLYAHMSRYSKLKKGSRVKQGQVIGYVGSTGLATGPHLHYEFYVNGSVRNPLTVKLPAAAPIAKKYKKDFQQKTQALLAQLKKFKATVVAQN